MLSIDEKKVHCILEISKTLDCLLMVLEFRKKVFLFFL